MIKVTESGSISYGTHKTEDLVPTFLDELETHKHPRAQEFAETWANIVNEDGDDGRIAQEFLYETLWNAMQELAAEGLYFSTHVGNGSDIGYWYDSNI